MSHGLHEHSSTAPSFLPSWGRCVSTYLYCWQHVLQSSITADGTWTVFLACDFLLSSITVAGSYVCRCSWKAISASAPEIQH